MDQCKIMKIRLIVVKAKTFNKTYYLNFKMNMSYEINYYNFVLLF